MKSLNSSEVAALIPEYWDRTASTVEDVIFFGQITIREMIRSWRSHANRLSSHIKEVDEKSKLMQGKNATNIIKIAKQSENPEFPQIGVRKDSWGDDPEPLDAASIDRQHDATTFNVCGWCKYARDGSRRYNYYITTSCSIKNAAGIEDEDRKFNAPCVFKTADDSFFDQIRNGLESTRQRLIEEKRQTDGKIKLLLTLEKRAEKKPAMPDHRPRDWFNVNDFVVCYVGGCKDRVARDNFVGARVIDSYRHHDGCVSVRYDERVHTGEYLGGHGGGFGISRPEVMHMWEFGYLIDHPDFASLWLNNGYRGHFLSAFGDNDPL